MGFSVEIESEFSFIHGDFIGISEDRRNFLKWHALSSR